MSEVQSEANNFYHKPVLLQEVVELIFTEPQGIYVDGTIGGGGHSQAILDKLGENGKIFGFDKDPEAIEYCKQRFRDELAKGELSRLELFNECFSKACSITGNRGRWTALLLDLGVSSRQLSTSRRGFSYRANGPLDLRFGRHGISAEELVNAADEEDLVALLRKFGEEPFAKSIASNIIKYRKIKPIETTFELREIVEKSVPRKHLIKSLSRVFQAIRIAINKELEVLEEALNSSLNCLKHKGRIAVISYHSLEDRIVKNFFRIHSTKKSEISNSMPKILVLTKKPITPSEQEIHENPRSRSAKLRVGEVIRND